MHQFAMAVTFILFVANIYIVSCKLATTTPISLEYKPNRPFYAGATGGNWENYVGQRVPPGKPWPAKPEDYPGFSVTTTRTTVTLDSQFISSLENLTESIETANSTSVSFITTTEPYSAINESNQNIIFEDEDNLETVSPNGTEEHGNLSTISHKPDLINLNLTTSSTLSPINETNATTQIPNDSPFLGPTGGNLIPQSTPWPDKPEDYVSYNLTSQKPIIDENVRETTTQFSIQNTSVSEDDVTKPWPATPENYEGYNLTFQDPNTEKYNKNTTTSSTTVSLIDTTKAPSLPLPNRPPFLGPTGGNFIPQIVPPGKPWPAKPEDYEGFNLTSQNPNYNNDSKTMSLTTQSTSIPLIEATKAPSLPVPNRPPFLGPTGGNFIPQIVPPGKPWPARPQDYEGYNIITTKPHTESAVTSLEGLDKPSRPQSYEGCSVTSQEPSVENEKEDSAKENKPPAPPKIFTADFYLGDENSTQHKRPSFSISINMDAVNAAGAGWGTSHKESTPVGATQQFLSAEKMDNTDQSKNQFSVWINLRDLIESPKRSSMRLNINSVSNSTTERTYLKSVEQRSANEKQLPIESVQNIHHHAKNPLMSVFVNFEDFRSLSKNSSSNKREVNTRTLGESRSENIFKETSRNNGARRNRFHEILPNRSHSQPYSSKTNTSHRSSTSLRHKEILNNSHIKNDSYKV